MTRPRPDAMTAEETRLAEALTSLVDYTGRVLLTGLADTSPHYIWDKASTLAEVAGRVADLAGKAAEGENRGKVRMPAVASAIAEWAQNYTAGRLLFPKRGGGAR